MTPPVSVILPAFNAATTIETAVRSWDGQTMPSELIAVDDGSTDATGRILDRLAQERPAMRVIHQPNGGAAAARNAALAIARAPVLAFLDADDVLHPEALEHLHRALFARPDAELVYPRCRWIGADGKTLGRVSPPPADRMIGMADLLTDNPIHSGTGVMLRRSAAERAGAFDADLPACIDIDFWGRAAGGDRISGLDRVLVDYRQTPGQITGSWRRMAEGWEKAARKSALDPATIRTARARTALVWSYRASAAGDHRGARDAARLILANDAGFALRTPRVWMRLLSVALAGRRG